MNTFSIHRTDPKPFNSLINRALRTKSYRAKNSYSSNGHCLTQRLISKRTGEEVLVADRIPTGVLGVYIWMVKYSPTHFRKEDFRDEEN